MIHPSTPPNPITSPTWLLFAMSFVHCWKSESGKGVEERREYNRGQKSSDITEAVVSISMPFFSPTTFGLAQMEKRSLASSRGKWLAAKYRLSLPGGAEGAEKERGE